MTGFDNAIQLYLGDKVLTTYILPEESEIYFWFDVDIGKTYTFTTFSDYDLVADLYDSSFTRIMTDDDSGYDYNPRLEFIATSERIYFKVRPYSNSHNLITVTTTFMEGSWYPSGEKDDVIRCTAIPVYGYGRSNNISG